MLRLIYTAAISIAAPLALAVSALRGPAHRERLGERLGFTRLRFDARPIWLHAASVGEVQAAAPLVRRLRVRFPDTPMLVTTFTHTGAQRVQSLFGGAVSHAYLPYDTPGAVRRFLDRVQPRLAIVMEREIWPTLFSACAARRVPVLLASARISAPSAARHRRLASLFAPTLRENVTVAAQTAADAERYRSIGAPASAIHTVGSIKFDLEAPVDAQAAGERLRATLGSRPVWVAGSTHDGEETIVLDAHDRLRATHPNALLILVPRHPQRFADVAALLVKRRMAFVSRSSQQPVGAETSVLFADTLGELLMFYAASDVAFVGGSLAPIGGHNLLEPAALGKPIVVGPHNFNAADVAALVLGRGAGVQVASAEQLASVLAELFSDPARRAAAGAAGRALIAENRGALDRVMQLIEGLNTSA